MSAPTLIQIITVIINLIKETVTLKKNVNKYILKIATTRSVLLLSVAMKFLVIGIIVISKSNEESNKENNINNRNAASFILTE